VRTFVERRLFDARRRARRRRRISENDIIIRNRIRKLLYDCRSIEPTKGARPRGIGRCKWTLRREGLDKTVAIERVSLAPWLGIERGAISRVHPTAIDEHGGILVGTQERREDVDARRPVTPSQCVDDLLRVVLDPAHVNSAKVSSGGIAWQRVELDFGGEPSCGDDVVRLLPRPEPSDLPAAEEDADDCDRDGENAEYPFAQSHARNMANRARAPKDLSTPSRGCRDPANERDLHSVVRRPVAPEDVVEPDRRLRRVLAFP
jgi:hypothetical protein